MISCREFPSLGAALETGEKAAQDACRLKLPSARVYL
jgi:hypothetical protein